MELFIFTKYGVGDQPPEFDETNFDMQIMIKDEEISALEAEISFLKNRGRGKNKGAVIKSADSWQSHT